MPNPPAEIIEIVERGPQGEPGLQGSPGTPGSDAHVTPENVALAGAFMKTEDTLDDIPDGDNYKKLTAAQLAALASTSQLQALPYSIGDQSTPQTVGANKLTFRIPYGFLLSAVKFSAVTPPTGSAMIFDVKMNGTSIFATKPQIDAGADTSKTSAVPFALYNDALLSDAKITVDIVQVGSSVAGAGIVMHLIGNPGYENLSSLVPLTTDSFSDAVGRLSQLYIFDFGTSKVADSSGNIPITNFTQLAQYFNANSTNAGTTVINKEVQRYVSMPADPSTDLNFVMASDALELTCTHTDASGPTILRYNPTANVTKSRVIPLADTSQIKVGQVVGFGHVVNEPNHARLRTYVIDGTITPGDVFSLAFRTRDDVVPLFTITTTATPSSTYASLAQSMVDQINANVVLQSYNIQAYVMPECPGGYVVCYPKRSRSDIGAPNFGKLAKDSLLYWDWGATTVAGTVSNAGATIGNPAPGGSNVGSISFAKAVTYTGVDQRTVTITCTTGGASGTAKVSIAATGSNAPFTTLTNQTVTNGTNLTLPDGARITPTIGTNLSVGDTWTVALVPPVTHQSRQEVFVNYVVAKTGNSITVAMPVTITTSDTVTLSPTRMLHVVNNSYNAVNIPVGNGLEAGITLGQTCSFSYQDNNLRIITAVAGGNITIEANVYAYKGLIMSVYPINMALSSAGTTASDTLTFTAVPAGVKVGMFAAPYFGSPYSTGIVKVIAVTATTVQLNTALTAGSGTRWVFHPEVLSAQIWSKFFMAPPLDNRSILAMEIECEVPGAWDIAAWPAFWAFTDTTGPRTPITSGTVQAGSTSTNVILAANASSVDNFYVGASLDTLTGTGSGQSRTITAYNGTTKAATVTALSPAPDTTTTYQVSQTATSEIDFIDYFNYFNNSSTGNYNCAGGGGHTGTMRAGSTSNTAVLSGGASDQPDAYVGLNLVTTSGTGSGQTRLITAYDPVTKTATLATAWTTTPNNTTGYRMDSVVSYLGLDAIASGAEGNNLGTFSRKVGCILTNNKLYFYLDGLLMVCKSAHWNEAQRMQFAANLAMGSINTSFVSNGFYPIENSVFPCKFRLKKMKFWSAPNRVKPL